MVDGKGSPRSQLMLIVDAHLNLYQFRQMIVHKHFQQYATPQIYFRKKIIKYFSLSTHFHDGGNWKTPIAITNSKSIITFTRPLLMKIKYFQLFSFILSRPSIRLYSIFPLRYIFGDKFQHISQLQDIRKLTKMGNKNRGGSQYEFQSMVNEVRKTQNRKVTVNPQKKYRDNMLAELQKTKFPPKLKEMVRHTLTTKISQIQLIDTVTCINALKNNKFQLNNNRGGSIIKDKPESKFVKIIFGQAFFKNIFRKLPINLNFIQEEQISLKNTHEQSPTHERKRTTQKSTAKKMPNKLQEGQMKQKLKDIGHVMKKQLSRSTHPFVRLTKSFAEFMQSSHSNLFPEYKKGQQELYEKVIRQLITQWCNFLESSCLQPYRKWIMSYIGLEENKYVKWIKNIALQQIWVANNGYLSRVILAIIQDKKIAVNLNLKQIKSHDSQLTPSLFNIDPKLQIQGNFFDSIYQMSELVTKLRPEQILGQLQVVKKRICSDIDNYHRLIEKGEMFEIDSDNIIGIVSYILCKIASKIDQIHTHLIYLRIIYGQNVYFSMGVGSYMLSTIFGALQFLESEEFIELINAPKQNPASLSESDKNQKPVQIRFSCRRQQKLDGIDRNRMDEVISKIYSMIATTKEQQQQQQS